MKKQSINFDKKIERIGSDCVKYDALQSYFGAVDVKPLWVADMDFAIPVYVQKALKQKLKQQLFGYEIPSENSFEAVIQWQKRHDLNLKKENILFCSGVVPSLKVAIETFSNIDDEIIIFPPVYFPFFSVIKDSARVVIESKLILENSLYCIDFKDLESKISKKTKMILLCSPHNPAGRVWSKNELIKLNAICEKYNIFVVSDEIHSDLVFKKFTSFASINKNSLILNAPSKTFNVAGLNTSYAFSLNKKILEQFNINAKKYHVTSLNSLSNTLIQSCYTKDGQIWLDNLLKYLQGNIDFTNAYFKKHLPTISITKTEATYLLWLNFKNTNLNHNQIKSKLLNESKIALNDGTTFGSNGKYFFRLNIALPKKELKLALQKITDSFKTSIK